MRRTIEIDLEYQNLIPGPPRQDLYQQACSGDSTTVTHWRDTWLGNYKKAKEHFGELGKLSYGRLHGVNRHKPAICIASGPSLKYSLDALRENQNQPNPVLTISTLHNFGYFEDEGIHPDYYLTLDSGPIVLEDIAEGRKESNYWDRTKDKKLIAYAASDLTLFEKWQGEIFLFNCLIPDLEVRKALAEVEVFNHYISSGGNAGGAVMYTAKAIMGSNHIIYVGYDMCFDYDSTFHSYKTHYDEIGQYIRATDVYGNQRKTWPSYYNFKCWFDHMACIVPGRWTNSSEGLLGAYKEGNIAQYEYRPLQDALTEYWMADVVYPQKKNEKGEVLETERIELGAFFSDSKGKDMVLF